MSQSILISTATRTLGWMILAFLLASPAQGGEARRCQKDGKVVITDMSCEMLGNAQDLSPTIPKNYVKRGEPESSLHPPSRPVQAAISPSPVARSSQSVDSAIQNMVKEIFQTIFLPFIVILALVSWFTRKTKQSLKRKLANVLIDVARDHLARRSSAKSASAPQSNQATSRHEPSLATVPNDSPTSCPTEWSLSLIRDLEWKRFEDVCQQFYELKGIRSETTPLGPDGGIDIRLYQDESGKPTSIVQCKAWNERYVGVSLVRELLGVMTHEKIAKAFFMTTSTFSAEAKTIASSNRITLIDGSMFLMMIQRLPAEDREKLLAFATKGDYRTPTCPSCGVKMVARPSTPGRAEFWGCPRYPVCRQTLGKRR